MFTLSRYSLPSSPAGGSERVCELARQAANETNDEDEGQRSEVKGDFSTNMVEHGDIRVVHRGGSKINLREPVITSDSRSVLVVSRMILNVR